MLALAQPRAFVIGFLAFVAGSFALTPYLGRDFFPSVDAGQILMHARARVGTRVEESANQFAEITKAIRQIIPPDEIATIVDNIGMPGQRHQHDLQQHRHHRHRRTATSRSSCARAIGRPPTTSGSCARSCRRASPA